MCMYMFDPNENKRKQNSCGHIEHTRIIQKLQVYVPQNIRKIYFLHQTSKTRF